MITGSLEGFKKWILMSENERRMMEKEYINQEKGNRNKDLGGK